ncbi:hypothetical protein BD414DRAFT_580151 [Trametes punicea]|nr:hypothetical protein BD414DRAFT_580151 [Trametes punicea]
MPSLGCSRCQEPCTDEYLPARDAKAYLPGEICAIKDSPDVPIYLLLTGGRPPPTQSDNSRSVQFSSVVSARTAASGVRDGYNPRPCIVLEPAPTMSHVGSLICLMATLVGRSQLDELCEILKLFCVHVSPHSPANLADHEHIHTYPEWCKDNTWLIAFRYSSTVSIEGRWRNYRSQTQPHSSFKLDATYMEELIRLCERRLEEWEKIVQDNPTARKAYLRDYRKHSKRAAKQKKKNLAARDSARSSARASTVDLPITQDSGILCAGATPSESGQDTSLFVSSCTTTTGSLEGAAAMTDADGYAEMAGSVAIVADPDAESAMLEDTSETMVEEAAASD